MPKRLETTHLQVARSRAAALAAASDIIDVSGPEGLGYVAVAERSGVGRTTLYRHWPTIERMIYEVLEAKCRIAHSPPSGDLLVDLVEEVDGLRRQLADPAVRQAIIIVISRAPQDPALFELWAQLRRECSQPVRQLLRAGQRAKALQTGINMDRAEAALLGPVFYSLLGHNSLKRTDVRRIIEDFVLVHSLPNGS